VSKTAYDDFTLKEIRDDDENLCHFLQCQTSPVSVVYQANTAFLSKTTVQALKVD